MKLIYTFCIAILLTISSYAQSSKLLEQQSSIRKVEIEYDSIKVTAYEVTVKSLFDHSIETFFPQAIVPSNTPSVTKPMAYIKLLTGADHKVWQEGFTYELRVRTFGIFPAGGIHYIYLEDFDPERHLIQTREHNNLAKVWDHTLTYTESGTMQTYYEDKIIICTKKVNRLYARYLVSFYKMRHRKWNRKLNKL